MGRRSYCHSNHTTTRRREPVVRGQYAWVRQRLGRERRGHRRTCLIEEPVAVAVEREGLFPRLGGVVRLDRARNAV